MAAVIGGLERIIRLEAAGEKATPQRAVGHEADPQAPHGGQDFVLHVARPQRVFRLQRRDRVHLVGAFDGAGRGFRKAHETHLALAHEVRHGAHRFLDGRLGVHAVLVIQVDHLDAQALQALLAAFPHIVRLAIHAEEGAVRPAHIAELRGDHALLALAPDGSAHEFLIGTHAIHVRRVEEGDAEVERAVDGGDGFRIVASRIEIRHAHATEPHGGNSE